MIPFVDLSAAHAEIEAELNSAIQAVLKKTDFILGQAVADFEKDFAAYCGTKHCVGVNSGLDALTLALRAGGVGPGDEVITVANTFIATALAVIQAGATPVLVDCEARTLEMDLDRVEAAITPKTRAIIAVHLFGRLIDMDRLRKIVGTRKILLLEDAAQAHGAQQNGKRAGNLGNVAAFSFYPTKNLGACGDGGAITTNDDAIADYVRIFRTYGQKEKNVHSLAGTNSRLDTLQAAALRVKLKRLDAWNASRQQLAAHYSRALAGLPIWVPPLEANAASHVWHLYTVRVPQRDRVQQALKDAGIQFGVHYPTPIHLQPAFAEYKLPRGTFPVAEAAASELLSLPMYPQMTEKDVDSVAQVLRGCLKK